MKGCRNREALAFGAFIVVAVLAVGCSVEPISGPKQLSSWGTTGSAPGEFRQPIGIAVASDGMVFVADAGNHRVQAFDAAGKFRWAFGSRGEEPGEFRRPMDWTSISTPRAALRCRAWW